MIRSKAIDGKIDVIIATPPCQGFSRACRNQDENDSRNLLIMPVISLIKEIKPKYVFIENVPQLLETEVEIGGKKTLIQDYMVGDLGDKYNISFHQINTENYGVPQSRRRTIILLTRKDQKLVWELPEENEDRVTLEDVIGDLPPLDPFIKDIDEIELKKMFPDYEKKKAAARKVSIWHQPPIHIKRQVVTMIHTPTGKTAFDNKKYIPRKEDGTAVKGYKSTYRRLRWIDPASTVTMDNRKISSQNNVHPGHYLGEDENGDVVYSDPRVLSLFELMRHMIGHENYGLVIDRQVVTDNWSHIQIVRHMIDNRLHYSNRGIPVLCPMYLYEDGKAKPNVNSEMVSMITEKTGISFSESLVESETEFDIMDLFDYSYGILNSPLYIEKYIDLLKIEFPKVPIPNGNEMFWRIVAYGRRLRKLHLLEEDIGNPMGISFEGVGDNIVSSRKLKPEGLYINRTQLFTNVTEEIWDFCYGGYHGLQKWFKDRNGMKLSEDDIQHVIRVLNVFEKTISIREDLDICMDEFGLI